MRRLPPFDRLLLAVGLPLWIVCFGLHAVEWSRGRLAWIPVMVSAGIEAGAPPVVSGFLPGVRAEEIGLRPGDRLLRVGGAELFGVGPFGFAAATWWQAEADGSVELLALRGSERRELRLALRPVGMGWRLPLLSLGFAVPAFLVLLRRPGSRSVRLFFGAALAYSLNWTFFFGGPPAQNALWIGVWLVSGLLFYPLALQAILSVPEAQATRPGGTAWTWIFSAYALTALAWVFGVPFSSELGVRASEAQNLMVPLLMLGLLAQRYRRSDPRGRRQLRWVLTGFLVGALPVALGSLVPVTRPELWWIHEILMSAVVLLPVCMVIAIVRFKLFDVDRLLPATLAYSMLLVVLAALLMGLVPSLAGLLARGSGIDPGTSQTLLSVLFAVGLVPGGRALRRSLERSLLAERRALERGVEQLLGELATAGEPEKIFRVLGERLDALLRPELCVIYASAGVDYSPVFQQGGAAPPVLGAEGFLWARLRERRGPLDVEDWRLRQQRAQLDAGDWALLDSLRAAILVPLFTRGHLLAVVVLGEKLSGDVYAGTDLPLLAAVGHSASTALERYGEGEIHRRALEMQQALRRYVPGAIAEEIEGGRPLREGRRQVSVLFVDIRGYTALAASRQAPEVFGLISRYTETVSRLVKARGGSIVEFNGDGMMAVFGAPGVLEAKERAALEAAVAISEALAELPLEGSEAGRGLDARIGIASGEAFVGSIRAVDRWIWSAIGNTTNLAARLQALCRDLDARIAIDEGTWAAAGAAAAGFARHRDVPVRGRGPQTLYVLPIGS